MKLFKHQKAALEKAKKQNLALFHECGTGKTLSVIDATGGWGVLIDD